MHLPSRRPRRIIAMLSSSVLVASLVPALVMTAPSAIAEDEFVPPKMQETAPTQVEPVTSKGGRDLLVGAQDQLADIEQRSRETVAAQDDAVAASDASASGTAARAMAAEASPVKGAGDYKATPLSAASSWSAGGSSGAFTWSYPLSVPSPAAGPVPSLAVSYDSGRVDGRTFVSNNQPSVIGEGFDLTSSYIERSYLSCDKDGHDQKFDLCWRGEKLTLVLNGNANELVRSSADTFRLKQDDGSTITRLDGATNGDNDGEYWKLVGPNGTEYVFGMNRLPGWSSGAPETDSAWTVPVVTDDANDPARAQVCASDNYSVATSWCQQAWRWNLDLVTDTSGNSATYWYTAETNKYARNKNVTNSANYDRQGYLNRIDYGLRRNALFNGNAITAAPFSVVLQHSERCLAADCGSLTNATKARWPDVPFEQICDDETCEPPCDFTTCENNFAPTFFTRKRLTGITTRHAVAGGGYRDVSRWTIDHVWLDPGDRGDRTDQILWPSKIQHQALAGTPAITSRPVILLPSTDASMRNRVDSAGDGIAPLIRPRLSRIVSETGSITDIGYSAPDCSPGNLPGSDAANGKRCFPVWWAPGGGDDLEKDWFHKYVVTGVSVTDTTTNLSLDTQYEYVGDPAWHYIEDHLTPNQYRTWSQWRGYRRVNTLVGKSYAEQRSLTASIYYRGMDGDRAAGGGSKQVSFAGVLAPSTTDRDEFAGMLRERILYNGRNLSGVNGRLETSSVFTPVVATTRATSNHPGGQVGGKDADPVTVSSTMVRTQRTEDFTVVNDPAEGLSGYTSRVADVTSYDDLGFPTRTHGFLRRLIDGQPVQTREHTCTLTTYARNLAAGILVLPSRVQKVATTCAAAGSAQLPANSQTPGQVISDVFYRYDGAANWETQSPTRGLATWRGRAIGYGSSGAPTLERTTTSDYDALGRVVSSTDRLDATTTTTYVPAGAGVPQSTKVTNALGHHVTTTFDPAFGVDTRVVDTNARVVEKTYDALGRLSAVWAPNVDRTLGAPATYRFDYHIGGAPVADNMVDGSWIATSTPKGDHPTDYVTTYEIYDSLLRLRQTQVPSPMSGRILTDTRYDHRGLVDRATSAMWDPDTAPNGTPKAWASGGAIHVYTTYDGAGRPTVETQSWTAAVQNQNGSTTRSRNTTYAYYGNTTYTSPPTGGLAQMKKVDDYGRTLTNRTYATQNATGDSQAVTFDYNSHGRLQTVTSGPTSVTTTYDLLGRKVQTNDSARGITTTTYDALDRVKTTTDAEQRTLSYTYDDLSRKTGLYGSATPSAATQLAGWTYDTVAKGKGLPATSTRYVGGSSGLAYTKSVKQYDPLDRPIRTAVDLPASDPLVSGPPSGDPARVSSTLEFQSHYRRDDTIENTVEPAVPGLSAEALTYGYDSTGLGLQTTLSGTTGIVQNTTYMPFGEVGLRTLGLSPANPQRAWINYEYDSLRRLKRQFTTETDETSHILDNTYWYGQDDMATQITAIQDLSNAEPDVQCFTNGAYQRLEHVWTPKPLTDRTAYPCAVSGRTTANLGGSEPYWNSYTYNSWGGRTGASLNYKAGVTRSLSVAYTYGGQCNDGSTTRTASPTALTSSTPSGLGSNGPTLYCTNAAGETIRTEIDRYDGFTRATAYDAEGNLSALVQDGAPFFPERPDRNYNYIYDADGALLIRRPAGDAPGTTTLYLGATEVQVTKNTDGTYRATSYRYYDHAGARIGVRIGKPASASNLYYLTSDHHGTATVQWRANNPRISRTKRFLDPFGAPRGDDVDDDVEEFVDDKRFLGKSYDGNTGITHVGARQYDPALGRFLSVDPILDTGDPQSMNGYTYSNNNPVNFSDPTGLRLGDNDLNPVPIDEQAPWEPWDPPIPIAAEEADDDNGGNAFLGFLGSVGNAVIVEPAKAIGTGFMTVGQAPYEMAANAPHVAAPEVYAPSPTYDDWSTTYQENKLPLILSSTSALPVGSGGSLLISHLARLLKVRPRAAPPLPGSALLPYNPVTAARNAPGSPLSVVPPSASMRQLNGIQGVEFRWKSAEGTARLRVHAVDASAPPGSNASSGPIFRLQVGGRYVDANGKLYPRNVHNEKSPHYDPAAANATHIPWPGGVPTPW